MSKIDRRVERIRQADVTDRLAAAIEKSNIETAYLRAQILDLTNVLKAQVNALNILIGQWATK
jgi:hypothetical protein